MTQKQEMTEWPVEIIRSAKRRKTVSAKLVDGTLVIRAPAKMSDADLKPVIEDLRHRLIRKANLLPQTNRELQQRAEELNRDYFGNELRWKSIRYVTNQNKRYGSCTPANGTIRLSDRLATMPEFVRDYVIVHELAHLIEANHGKRFWALVNRYPLTERARGYLMAVDLEKVEQT